MKRRTAILQPLLLASLLTIGTGVAWAAALVWSFVLAEQWFRPTRSYQHLVVSWDGTPLISSSPSAYRGDALLTLDGAEVPDDEPVQTISSVNLSVPRLQKPPLFKMGWERRIASFAEPRRPPIYWYFVHDGNVDGSGYFVGYDSLSRSCIGHVGIKGFRPEEPPPAERIPVDGRLMAANTAFSSPRYYPGQEPYYDAQGMRELHMVSGDRVLEVDLRRRAVRTLLEQPEIHGLTSFSRPILPPAKAEDGEQTMRWQSSLVVYASDRVILLDFRGRVQRSYLLPEQLRNKSLTFWEISDGTALLDRSHRTREGDLHSLYWIDTAGNIMRQREVRLETGAPAGPATTAWLTSVAMPAPIVAAIAAPMAAGETGIIRDEPLGLVGKYQRGFADAWPALLAVLFVAAVMAWLCHSRQERYAQPWTTAWVVFVLLSGVPGLIGYLLHRRWPMLGACPACSAVVPRDRECCAHCGADFPEPQSSGVEVCLHA